MSFRKFRETTSRRKPGGPENAWRRRRLEQSATMRNRWRVTAAGTLIRRYLGRNAKQTRHGSPDAALGGKRNRQIGTVDAFETVERGSSKSPDRPAHAPHEHAIVLRPPLRTGSKAGRPKRIRPLFRFAFFLPRLMLPGQRWKPRQQSAWMDRFENGPSESGP